MFVEAEYFSQRMPRVHHNARPPKGTKPDSC
jgi:hypothetical protein